MTEFDIQEILFDHFVTLNDFSGIKYIEIDNKKRGWEKYKNVAFPNVPFKVPENKRWFELAFINADPNDAAIMGEVQYRFTGILKIDIITPQDCGEDEAKTKYRWIAKLFNDAELDYIDIIKVYISTKGNDADHYRLQVTIDWTADIDKE